MEVALVVEEKIIIVLIRKLSKTLVFVDGVVAVDDDDEGNNNCNNKRRVVSALITTKLLTDMDSHPLPKFRKGSILIVRGRPVINKKGLPEIECSYYKQQDITDQQQPVAPMVTSIVIPQLPPPMCLYFRRGLQLCDSKNCTYRHFFVSEREELFIQKQRDIANQRRLVEKDMNDHLNDDDKSPKSRRARIFVDWLLNQYGVDFLNQGSGVVDVAGGNGFVTLRLIASGVTSTVIDPREPKLSTYYKRALKHIKSSNYHRNSTTTSLATFATHLTSTISDTISPKSTTTDTSTTTPTSDTTPLTLTTSDTTPTTSSTTTPLPPPLPSVPPSNMAISSSNGTRNDSSGFFVQAFFTEDSLFNDQQSTLIQNASIIIGLHPDQPTECIVDTSLKLQKPFAVVPCCVFPKLFPERRLRDGTEVISNKQFCQYLLEKNPQINKEYLPIKGRNKVIYLPLK